MQINKIALPKKIDQKKKLLFDTMNKKFLLILASIGKYLKEHENKIEKIELDDKESENFLNKSVGSQGLNSEKIQNFNKLEEKKENFNTEKEEYEKIEKSENSEFEKIVGIKKSEDSEEEKIVVLFKDKMPNEESKIDFSRQNRKESDFSEAHKEKIIKKEPTLEIKIERSGSFTFQNKEINSKNNKITEINRIFGLKNVGNSCKKF